MWTFKAILISQNVGFVPTTQVAKAERMGSMEIVDSFHSIAQVGKWLPGLISFRPIFPMY